MNKKIIFRILVSIGIADALVVIIAAMTGQNAYVLANSIANYYNLLFAYIPLMLIGISVIWWLIDTFLKIKERVNYFAIAFCALMAGAVFLIGTIFFAEGR